MNQQPPVYFTFPDGVFSYECRGCAACCKGLGIGLDAAGGQLEMLTRLYPGLSAFARRRGSTWTMFNPRGGCWFLDREGLCRIESEHGRNTKPASCRLFPFNRVFLLGELLIVDYNSVICPLKALVEDASDAELGLSGRVEHAALLQEINCIADPGVVGSTLPASDPVAEGQEFYERESRIAATCFVAANRAADAATIWSGMGNARSWEHVERQLIEAHELLIGEAWAAPTAETLRHALLLVPSLRFNELYGPRRYTTRGALLEHLPGITVSWLHHLAAGERLNGEPLTLQQATSLWSEQIALMYLAARWHELPSMKPGRYPLPDEASDRQQHVRRFVQACIGNRGGRTLGQLLTNSLGGLPIVERVAVCRSLQPLLGELHFGQRRPAKKSQKSAKGKRKRRR